MLWKTRGYRRLFVISWCLILPSFVQAGNWYAAAEVGLGASKIGKTQTLTLFSSPSPSEVDQFSVNQSYKLSGLAGLQAGYRFDPFQQWQITLDASVLYLANDTINGILHPLVNVASDFDVLNFSYDVETYIVGLAPTLIYLTGNSWHPFVSCLLGVGLNRAYAYHESTPAGSTATPSGQSFQSNTHAAFAFAPKIGIEQRYNCHTTLRYGLAYFNTGEAKFNPMPNQQTSQAIRSGTLSSYFVTFDMLIS